LLIVESSPGASRCVGGRFTLWDEWEIHRFAAAGFFTSSPHHPRFFPNSSQTFAAPNSINAGRSNISPKLTTTEINRPIGKIDRINPSTKADATVFTGSRRTSAAARSTNAGLFGSDDPADF
jgi:hypothetical protein